MEISHTAVLGEPGSGKSLSKVGEASESERSVVEHWHEHSLAWETAKHDAADGRRFVLDNFGWTRHGVVLKLLRAAKGEDEGRRRKKNQRRLRRFARI